MQQLRLWGKFQGLIYTMLEEVVVDQMLVVVRLLELEVLEVAVQVATIAMGPVQLLILAGVEVEVLIGLAPC
jgi:hypothetical protein